MTSSEYRYRDESENEQEDVAVAALAAIASSRKSPADGSGGKKRPTLPSEFREKNRRSFEGRVSDTLHICAFFDVQLRIF